MNRKIILISVGLCAISLFSSCNTISGVGKDLSSVGGVLTNSASKRYVNPFEAQPPVQYTTTTVQR